MAHTFSSRNAWIAALVLLLSFVSCDGSASAAEGGKTVPLGQWSFDDAGAAAWTTDQPTVGVKVVPAARPGTAAGNACLEVEVREPGKKLQIRGPEVALGATTPYVSRRWIRLNAQVRAQGLSDGAVQIRLMPVYKGKPGGNWMKAVRPRRDWDRVVDMPLAESWADWVAVGEEGVADNGATGVIPVIWIDTDKAGKFFLDDLALAEYTEVNHRIVTKQSDNIYAAGQGTVTVEFADPKTLVKARVRMEDELGRARGDLTVSEGPVKLLLPEPGYYQVIVEGEYQDGSRIVSREAAVVAGDLLPESLRRASVFGIVRVHGSRETMTKLGANWEYHIGSWSGAKLAEDGTIQLGGVPEKTEGFAMTCTLAGGALPEWMTGRNSAVGLCPPKDWEQYGRLVEAAVRNAKTLPEVIACYNESDAHWRGSFEDFVRFHKTFTQSVRKARPEAVIAGPCMYSIRMDEFRKCDKAGMFEGLDAIMMHGYVNATAPEGDFMDRIRALTGYLAETGRGAMPIYLTEFGWTGKPGDWQAEVDELTKARYCSRSLVLLATEPQMKGLCYFAQRFGGSAGPGYGILDNDNHPLPAVAAYAHLTRQLTELAGKGQWLALSPTRHLVVFPLGADSRIVAWDAATEGVQSLPAAAKKATEMTGRALVLTEAGQVPVSQSPVFLDLPGQALLGLPRDAERTVLPGLGVELAADRVLAVPGLEWEKGVLRVRQDAALGRYLAIYERGGKWRALPMTVPAPLEIGQMRWSWAQSGEASLTVQVRSRCGEEVVARATAALEGRETSSALMILRENQEQSVTLTFRNLPAATRLQGKLTVALESGAVRWGAEAALDKTFVGCATLKATPDEEGWKAIPAMDFSRWEPRVGKSIAPIDPADCSATLQLAASPEGLHVRVKVRDDQHMQKPMWSGMWQEDSIQLALDPDTEKEWQPNNVGNGVNGHRIFEYGVCLSDKGETQTWRFRAEAPGRKAGPEFNLRPKVTRDAEAQVTQYTLMIPWKEIGLEAMPAVGGRIGISLLVNDKDTGTGRKMLQLFRGIGSDRDPVNFGQFWLLPPAQP